MTKECGTPFITGCEAASTDAASTLTVPVTKVGMYLVKRISPIKAGEPIPHGKSVELAEKSRMVKADPTDSAILDGFGEGGGSSRRPAIGRVVELDE